MTTLLRPELTQIKAWHVENLVKMERVLTTYIKKGLKEATQAKCSNLPHTPDIPVKRRPAELEYLGKVWWP